MTARLAHEPSTRRTVPGAYTEGHEARTLYVVTTYVVRPDGHRTDVGDTSSTHSAAAAMAKAEKRARRLGAGWLRIHG